MSEDTQHVEFLLRKVTKLEEKIKSMADENLTQLCLFKDFKREMQSRLADLEYGSRRSMQDMAMRMPLR